MTDARIPDHCAWAARGRWREAYDAAEAEVATLRAELDAARGRVKPGVAERIIWDAMAWAVRNSNRHPGTIVPAYTDTGNSDAEYEARRSAARILAALEPDPAMDRMREALIWCSGSDDFQEGGKAREGWLKLCAPLIHGDAMTALEAVKAEAVAMRDFEIATLHRQISEAQSALEGLCRAHGMTEHREDFLSWLDETIVDAMEDKP
jgi:hypothetical protein